MDFAVRAPSSTCIRLDLFYVQVKPADVAEIVDQTLREGKLVERLLYADNGTRYRSAAEVPFYKLQHKDHPQKCRAHRSPEY